jgi:hypothetical protein
MGALQQYQYLERAISPQSHPYIFGEPVSVSQNIFLSANCPSKFLDMRTNLPNLWNLGVFVVISFIASPWEIVRLALGTSTPPFTESVFDYTRFCPATCRELITVCCTAGGQESPT